MARNKSNTDMKWKYTFGLFFISAVSLIGMMTYYKLDYSLLTSLSFYENLANPSVRIVRIQEGLRKEEIADIFANKLGWNDFRKEQFINGHLALNSEDLEGRYFPKTYMIPKDEDPLGVTSAMLHEFNTETSKIKKPKASLVLNQDTAIKIASIIQRESGGKSDMKLISGIIWNRLFSGMKLQIDATLQYAKGTEEDGWWKQVESGDKSIDSTYNTYKYKGLPPTAISNPGIAALDAAYNPIKTKCLYYLHDKHGKIHCSTTYEEHKANIKKYL